MSKRGAGATPQGSSPVKRQRENSQSSLMGHHQQQDTPAAMPAAGQAGAGAAPQSGPAMDPDQLSDALLSAGVDLREEENLLSSSLNADLISQKPFSMPTTDPSRMFLNMKNVQSLLEKTASAQGLRLSSASEDKELAGLLSAATAEWLADILGHTALLSRHRRLSTNTGAQGPVSASETQSAVSRALRTLAQHDKDAEQSRNVLKVSLGIGVSSTDKKQQESEETQYRAVNDTARIMTSGRKRYSWQASSSQASGATPGLSGQRSRPSEGLRVRELREEPGIALRDLLGALENKHVGVKRVLMKGYTRSKD